MCIFASTFIIRYPLKARQLSRGKIHALDDQNEFSLLFLKCGPNKHLPELYIKEN